MTERTPNRDNQTGDAQWGEWIDRIAAGDGSAVEELYDDSSRHVFTFLLRAMPTRDAAEQAVIEVFRSIPDEAREYRAAWSTPFTWLMSVTRKVAISIRCKNGSHSANAFESGRGGSKPTMPVFESIEARERRRLAISRLEQLTEEQRRILDLTYFGGFTSDEIAAHLQIPLVDVRHQVHLAMLKLRYLVKETKAASAQP